MFDYKKDFSINNNETTDIQSFLSTYVKLQQKIYIREIYFLIPLRTIHYLDFKLLSEPINSDKVSFMINGAAGNCVVDCSDLICAHPKNLK